MIDYLENILAAWKTSTETFFPKMILAIIVFFLFVIIGRIARKMIVKGYARLTNQHPDIAGLISSAVNFFFLVSGIFVALDIMGLEKLVTKLMASAGIVGIVAGFAFKDIASSAFAGFLLKTRRPFKKGDWVQFNEEYGKVTDITLMTTSMKNILGQEVFIPNQLIYNDSFTNFSTYGTRRIMIKSGVSYGDDLEYVKEVAIDEVQKSDFLMPGTSINFYFTEIGDSTFNFELLYWITFTDESEYYQARSTAIINIKKRFDKENISIAYPVTTLDFGVKGGVNLFDKDLSIKNSRQ